MTRLKFWISLCSAEQLNHFIATLQILGIDDGRHLLYVFTILHNGNVCVKVQHCISAECMTAAHTAL